MRWQYKCLIDGLKGIIPFQNELRTLKYRLLHYEPDAPSTNAWTIREGLRQLEWIRTVHPIESASVMEIGSGWQPMIPILFSLAGAGSVYLTDLHRLCRPDSFYAAICSVRRHKQLILDALGISEKTFDDLTAWEPSNGLAEGFRRLRLRYMAPCDCRHMDLPSGSIDVVISRAVLEHIPPMVIQEIFTESFRLLAPDGIACHFIDNSDHWEHRDKSISRVNFLKFSDGAFWWTCLNPANYQNRLRHPEYMDMLTAAGFSILREEREMDPKAVSALETLPIASRFRRFTPEELAIISSDVLARKPVPQLRSTAVELPASARHQSVS